MTAKSHFTHLAMTVIFSLILISLIFSSNDWSLLSMSFNTPCLCCVSCTGYFVEWKYCTLPCLATTVSINVTKIRDWLTLCHKPWVLHSHTTESALYNHMHIMYILIVLWIKLTISQFDSQSNPWTKNQIDVVKFQEGGQKMSAVVRVHCIYKLKIRKLTTLILDPGFWSTWGSLR